MKGHNFDHCIGDICKKCGKLHINGLKGKHLSAKTRAKISAKLKGKPLSAETKAKLSKSHLGNKNLLDHKNSAEQRARQGASLKKHIANLTDEQFIAWINHGFHIKKPTSFEQKIVDLINQYHLPFKYVGNGKLWINRKNPDFISTDSNTILEVYFTKTKSATYEIERKAFFPNKTLIFFNEHDLFRPNWQNHCLTKLNYSLEKLQQCNSRMQ